MLFTNIDFATALLPNNFSTLHDKGHSRHLRDIRQRIAGDGDDVGELALLDRSDVGRPPDEIRRDGRRGGSPAPASCPI